MNRFHTKLTQKYQTYNNWHQTKHHNKAHWGVFILFSFFISTLLLNPLELNLKKDNNNSNFLSDIVIQKKEAKAAYVPPPGSPLANKEHPRLFLAAEDLLLLRDKLKTQYKTELQDFINTLDSSFNDDIASKSRSAKSNDAMNYAFLYLVDPGQMAPTFTFGRTRNEYGQKGISHGLAIAQDVLDGKISIEALENWEPINMPMALVYDWVYPSLTIDQKRKFADAFIKSYQTRALQPGLQLGAWTLYQNFRGATGGLAFWGDALDDSTTANYYANQAQILLDLVKTDWIDGIYANLNYFQDKSGWRESWSYNTWAFRGANLFTGMLTTALGQDYFYNTGYLRYHPLFFLYSIRPYSYNGENYLTRYDTMTERGVTQQFIYYSNVLYVAIGSLGNSAPDMAGLAKWMVNQGYAAPITNSNIRSYYLFYNFIWGNKNVIPKSPQDLNLPIAQKFGSGQIIMKTGFSSPLDTLIEFWAPKFQILPGGHPSPDFASFTIEKYGKLALNAGNNKTITIEGKNTPTFSSAVKSSMFHNVIGVYKPGEISTKYDKRNVMGYRDGGFDESGNKPIDPAYQDDGSNQVGDLKASELNQGDYNYINYNYSKAWDATKVSYANREFLYLNPTAKSSKEYTVIFDRITSADPTYKKRFLLWSAFEPQTNGTFTQDPGIAWKYVSANSDMVKISNTYGTHHGRLFSKTLLPNSFKINKTGGPGHEFTDADYLNADLDFYSQNYGQLTDAVASWIGAWRTEIESTTNQKDDLFLHVMEIGDSNTLATMTPTQRIESSTGNMVGALIQDPNAPRILMFSRTDPLQTTVTYTAIYAGTGKHLLTGITPGIYDIYKNGAKILAGIVSQADKNTISFESTGGSEFQIVKTGEVPPPSDTTPPSIPTNLSTTPISSSQINLSWTASTDDVGVTGYRIYRDGSLQSTVSSLETSYSDTNLQPDTTYTYTVSVFDAADNESEKTTLLLVTTLYSFKQSDLNQDKVVNQLDFDILKQDFNRTDKPKSDLNQDGIVDSRDLGIMMSEWSKRE